MTNLICNKKIIRQKRLKFVRLHYKNKVMDKAKILSAIIDEQEKVINNLKASIERYKQESNMDEDNTLDPDDYARQNEAKDMQLRYENMLKSAKHNLNF
jgi:hypothetical protein